MKARDQALRKMRAEQPADAEGAARALDALASTGLRELRGRGLRRLAEVIRGASLATLKGKKSSKVWQPAWTASQSHSQEEEMTALEQLAKSRKKLKKLKKRNRALRKLAGAAAGADRDETQTTTELDPQRAAAVTALDKVLAKLAAGDLPGAKLVQKVNDALAPLGLKLPPGLEAVDDDAAVPGLGVTQGALGTIRKALRTPRVSSGWGHDPVGSR